MHIKVRTEELVLKLELRAKIARWVLSDRAHHRNIKIDSRLSVDDRGYVKKLKLDIGGITVSLNPTGNKAFGIDDVQEYFLCPTDSKADLALDLHDYNKDILRLKSEEKCFETGGVWDLYRRGGKYIFNCYSEDFGEVPYKTAVVNRSFSSGDIYFDNTEDLPGLSCPFEYPLDELLIMHLLSLGRGIMIHGCGLKVGGEGVLFVGSSGRGKSTIAKILKKTSGAVILNDDRIIIRKIGSEYRIYGTPWHGDVHECSNGSASLKRIYFIQHAGSNFSGKLGPAETAARLVACSFSPLWDAEGMAFILDFASRLAENTPSCELGFIPDENIAKFLKL